MNEAYLAASGARLRFRDEGAGFPIVFIHGWTLNLDMWEPQASGLRGTYRIVRMDRRGFGASEGTASLAADVRDLGDLLDYLGLRRVALVGMSQGARVAMHAAVTIASRMACLVLDGAPLLDPEGASADEIPIEGYRHCLATSGIDAFRSKWLQQPLMRLHAPDTWSSALLASMVSSYSGADLLSDATAAQPALVAVRPEDIHISTLVLNGEFDDHRRRVGDALCAAIPNAQRAIIARAGHLPNLDNPRAYNQVLDQFISRHSSRSVEG